MRYLLIMSSARGPHGPEMTETVEPPTDSTARVESVSKHIHVESLWALADNSDTFII